MPMNVHNQRAIANEREGKRGSAEPEIYVHCTYITEKQRTSLPTGPADVDDDVVIDVRYINCRHARARMHHARMLYYSTRGTRQVVEYRESFPFMFGHIFKTSLLLYVYP